MRVDFQCGFNVRVAELIAGREHVNACQIKKSCKCVPEPVCGNRRDTVRIVYGGRLHKFGFRMRFFVLLEIPVFQVENVPVGVPHSVPTAFAAYFLFYRAHNQSVSVAGVIPSFFRSKERKSTSCCGMSIVRILASPSFWTDLPLMISTDLLTSIVFTCRSMSDHNSGISSPRRSPVCLRVMGVELVLRYALSIISSWLKIARTGSTVANSVRAISICIPAKPFNMEK